MRPLLAALAVLLLAVPVASAQDATPTPSPSPTATPSSGPAPVVGGGSFNTAPLIAAGSYRDTLLPGERLFYGIKLQAGQRLRVTGQIDAPVDVFGLNTVGFSVGIQTPLREVDVLDLVDRDITGNGTVTTGSPTDRIDFVSAPVLAASTAREQGIVYRGPGIWYVSLYLSSDEQKPPRIEVPVNLRLQVIGDPQPDPKPEKTPAKATPAAGGPSPDDGGPSIGTVVGVGLVALIVGGALGAAAAAVTRRRRTA